MTEVLVLIEDLGSVQSQGETLTGAGLSKTHAELLTLAETLGNVNVVTGASGGPAARTLAVKGVQAVYTGDGEITAPDPALVDLLETAAAETAAGVILAADTPDATDALARLAVRRDAGIITSATGIRPDLTVSKAVLAGSYTTTSRPEEGTPLIATLRPNSVQPVTEAGHEPEITVLPVKPSQTVEILETTDLPASNRPPLTEARTVVAAGRGVDGDLSLIDQLAEELGAAVGASRVVTDAGWLDHSLQIGQTGVTVSPQLYISVGISGAVHQKAGMDTSGTIVAINKDEDAPVFEIADFGVVGDLTEVLPQLIDELRQRKG